MFKPLIPLLFTLALTACGSTGSSDGATYAQEKTPPEQQRATPPARTHPGYFSVPTEAVDRIEVRRFRFLSDPAPETVIVVDDPAMVKELCTLLAGLPVRGDHFMKMAPTVRHTHLRFHSGGKEVGEAHLYNGSLQMSDTAFLENPHPNEKRVVELVENLKP